MPRAPSQSSARPPLPQSGAEPAHVGGDSGSAAGAPAECPTTEHLASIEIPPSPGPVRVTVSYKPGSGNIVIRVSPTLRTAQGQADGSVRPGAGAGSDYVFRKKGDLWEVIFGGRELFYIKDSLGVRYLGYLLHEPNKAISAFDLEVAITPEKGEARSEDSIQTESDPQALREYRQKLCSLQLERNRARKAGERAKERGLDRDIKRLNAALREHGGMADTGERARNNVRHAVNAIKAQLREGSLEEQAFAEHLESHLSVGMECLYSQPQGRIWG